MKNVQKWAVLVGVLILPFLIYYLIVYSAKRISFSLWKAWGRRRSFKQNKAGTAWTIMSHTGRSRIRTAKNFPAKT